MSFLLVFCVVFGTAANERVGVGATGVSSSIAIFKDEVVSLRAEKSYTMLAYDNSRKSQVPRSHSFVNSMSQRCRLLKKNQFPRRRVMMLHYL